MRACPIISARTRNWRARCARLQHTFSQRIALPRLRCVHPMRRQCAQVKLTFRRGNSSRAWIDTSAAPEPRSQVDWWTRRGCRKKAQGLQNRDASADESSRSGTLAAAGLAPAPATPPSADAGYTMRAELIGHFKACMAEIYLHIVARMADYMATHP